MSTSTLPKSLFFHLVSGEKGMALKVMDADGKEVEPGYEFYSGHERQILKEIARLREHNALTIDWEGMGAGNEIYINNNDYLISLLLRSSSFVNTKGKRITLVPGEARVRATIEEQKKELVVSMDLWHDHKRMKKAVPVTESFLMSGAKMYQVLPLGRYFNSLALFETHLGPDTIEHYLTMLYSNLSNVDVDYLGYTIKEGAPKTTRPALIFDKVSSDQSLHMKVSVTYPGYSPDFFDSFELDHLAVVNDLERSITVSPLVHGDIPGSLQEIRRLLKKHAGFLKKNKTVYVQDNFMIIESALAIRFVMAELPGLLTRYTVMGAEKLASYKVKYVQPMLDLRLDHGIDFLEGEASLDIDGEKFSLNDVLKQYKKNAYVQLNDGSSAIINPDYMEKLIRIFKKRKSGVKVSFFDLPIVEELIGEKIARASFKKSREIFLGFNKLQRSRKKLPELNATLRGYQVQGFKWASYLHKHGIGGCLADDMGLGKTIQAIALLASLYPPRKRPSLIIMPKTLLFNWECEIKKFAPGLTFISYYGQNRDMDEARNHNLILTTYAMVRNDIKTFKKKSFHMVILDESQNIKNINSKTSKAIMLLKSDHRLALSGTPIENNLTELYSLFRFLNPSMFGTLADFAKNYLKPIQKEDNKEVAGELRKKIYPFILRRVKSEVLKDLPDKMEQTLYVDMTPEQKDLYHQRREMYRNAVQQEIKTKGFRKSQFFILQALGELRQIASIPEVKSDNRIISPKRGMLMEHMADAVAGGHKVLVFSNYLHSLDCISQDLDGAGIDHLVMTGSTRDRSAVVERFQNDLECKALLMTLKTGGLGLNLTVADYVFLFDPWWNAAVENQAVDRAHRMGQKNRVFSYRLIARESIEEKILKLQEKKKALVDALISSDNASIKKMDEADIDYMLGGE